MDPLTRHLLAAHAGRGPWEEGSLMIDEVRFNCLKYFGLNMNKTEPIGYLTNK